MDNLTHSLTALALARAGLNRFAPGATAVLLISANLPDIDIVAAFAGALNYLEAHRAYTHSLFAFPAMAALSVLLACAVLRRWLPFWPSFCLACIGMLSHLFLDWTNSYGIRLFLPFSPRWFHLDWNGLYDYLFLAILLFAFVWPYFGRLVRGEIGAHRSPGQAVPILLLLVFAGLEITRALAHQRVIAQLNTVLYGGQPALSLSALPSPGNPFLWETIVETASSYQVGTFNLLTSSLSEGVETFLKLPRDPAIEAARKTEPFHFFEYFARFPVWSEEPASTTGPKITRLDLTDLRFGRPGVGSFHSIALVDAGGQILSSQFTFGTGDKLGWATNGTMKQK